MADDEKEAKSSVTFHLIKTSAYETHHADGVICGLNPGGRAFLAFYVERPPIPQMVTHELGSDGTLGRISASKGKQGIIREMQTGIILDLANVEALTEQLRTFLEQVKTAESEKTKSASTST